MALQRNPISPRIREQLPALLATILDNAVEEQLLSSILQKIELAGLSRDVYPVLEHLATSEYFSTLAIALILPFLEPEQQTALSAHASEAPSLVDQFLPPMADRLVTAVPIAWAKTLREMFKNGELSSDGDWMPFIRALPMGLQREVLTTWASSALELAWEQDSENPALCIRPAARVRGLMFDMGLDELLPGA